MKLARTLLGASLLAAMSLAAATSATAAPAGVPAATATAASVKNIVLVHGMLMDGSGWRAVHDILVRKGYKVTIVQEPLTGIDADVAAVRRALDQQDGPVILVGHSYGGLIITEAGSDPKVKSLVYVAALQPEVGETMGALNASMPSLLPPTSMRATADGYVTVEPTAFARDVAGDVPESQASFLAASQTPTNSTVFTQKVTAAAWHDKKSYAIVATEDRTINPALERWMYRRSGAQVTEIKASHAVYISRPQAVADVIDRAARTVN